jgi:hypothetical protein
MTSSFSCLSLLPSHKVLFYSSMCFCHGVMPF